MLSLRSLGDLSPSEQGENAMELSRAIRYLIYMLLKALPLGEPGPRAGTRQKSSRRDDTAPSRNTRARAEPTDWLCEAARLASQDPGTCPGCTDAELQPCDGRDPDSPGPSACLVMTGEVMASSCPACRGLPCAWMASRRQNASMAARLCRWNTTCSWRTQTSLESSSLRALRATQMALLRGTRCSQPSFIRHIVL